MIILAITLLTLVYIINRLVVIQRARSQLDNKIVPRYVTTFSPFSAPALLLSSSALKYSRSACWIYKDILYSDAPLKTVIFQPLLYGRRAIHTAHPALFRQVLSVGAPYKKPDISILKVLGENMFSTNGEVWRRHRRVISPALNHVTYRNVWDTTANVYKEMIKEEGWLDTEGGKELDMNENTHKVALFLILMIGFGVPMSWSTPPFDELGNRSMYSLITSVTANLLLRGGSPECIFKLGIKKLNDIDKDYETFEKCMVGLISERERKLKNMIDTEESETSSGGEYIKDILGRLVYSRISEGKVTLSDEEIMGNCFIFAFAGHETTANTLAATLAELALNPDKQEWLYSQIIKVIDDRSPTFDDYDNLDCVLACFYEALRLYPPAYALLREPEKDMIVPLSSSGKKKGKEDLWIKKDDLIILDCVGMFYDAETFPDPYSFTPKRWLSDNGAEEEASITKDMDAGEVSGSSSMNSMTGFIGFSIGPRTCIGHKFAKVEAVSFITHVLREWRVEPSKKSGETDIEWRKRILSAPEINVTLAFKDVPLKFSKRVN